MNAPSLGFASLWLLVLVACGSSAPSAPSIDGGVGASLAGASTAGAPSAGSASGGTASGGTANGGTASGGTASGGTASGGTSSQLNGSIVPLYSYPDAPAWKAIVSAKALHPKVSVIAIVNPDSGPGASVDATFTKGIAALVAAQIVPIGYISTQYTQRGEPAVKADVDRWHTQYPAVQGIFFDEQSITVGDEAFYRDISQYAKGKGFTLTVGNPGTGVPSSFLDTVDVMLAYESAGTPSLASLMKYAPQRTHFGIIPYAAALDPAFAKAALKSVAYVYITDDTLPNPWNALPASFGSLLNALDP